MANFFLASKHHFALTSPAADAPSGLASGDVVGFTCIPDKEKGNAPFYKEIDGQYLVNLFSTSQAEPTAKNPEEEISIILDDFRSGFGQDVYNHNDPKRYFSSFGCDLSNKEMAIAGWDSTAVTIPAATTGVTLTDGGVEIWTDANTLTNWTKSGGVLAQDNANERSGVWCALLQNVSTVYQDIPATNYAGRRFTFTMWAKAANASNAKIQINDGVGTTSSSYHTGGGAYEQLTVTRVLSPSATRLRVQFVTDLGNNAYFDDAALTASGGGVGTTTSHATFNSLEYASFGSVLGKLNAGGTAFTSQYEFTVAITSLVPFQVSGTDYLFIFLGTSTAYWYMTTAEAFTESTATDKMYQYGAWVNTTADTIYANDGVNTIRSTTNPLNGGTAWSAQTIVGAAADAITHPQEKDGALLIDKEDMPYYLNSAGAVQKDLAPECVSGKSSHSGKNSIIWQGEYFRPTGNQALLRVGTSNSWIQPSKYATNLGDFTGQVEACAGDEEWLYITTDNSTKVEVQKGRDETIDGTTSWVWHPIHELTLTGVETMWISTVYQKRLWISSTSASESLYYLPLPTKYGDIINDSNASFKTTTYWETPYVHGRFKADTKGWLKTIATLAHAYDAGIYWTIQYKKLQDSSYTGIGNLVGTSTDRTHTLYVPVDGSSNNPVSTMMRFKLIAVTNDTAKTPQLRSLDIRAILYPTKKDIIWAKVKIAKEISTTGGTSHDKYAKMKACLEKCRDATYPVTLKDIDGNTTQVRFLQLPQNIPWREPVTDESKRDFDYQYNVLMLKSPTS